MRDEQLPGESESSEDATASLDEEAWLPPLPAGYVYVSARTTFLEMTRPAEGPGEAPAAPAGCSIDRWVDPPPDDYRRMFRAVGGPWGWSGRLLLAEERLAAILGDDGIEIWRIFAGSELAGFIELDTRQAGEVEIVYFGLRPEFVGRGLGGYVLRWARHNVWSRPGVRRFWLHTCDFDHPGALRVYERAGFRIYDERTGLEAYPADHVARLELEAADRTSGAITAAKAKATATAKTTAT